MRRRSFNYGEIAAKIYSIHHRTDNHKSEHTSNIHYARSFAFANQHVSTRRHGGKRSAAAAQFRLL